MRMYIWNRELLRRYASGMAVGVGNDANEARQAILRYAETQWPLNDDMGEYGEEFRTRLVAELSAPPDLVQDIPGGVYIQGGE